MDRYVFVYSRPLEKRIHESYRAQHGVDALNKFSQKNWTFKLGWWIIFLDKSEVYQEEPIRKIA